MVLFLGFIIAVMVYADRKSSQQSSEQESFPCPDCGLQVSHEDENCPGCERRLKV
jgi:rubrerythrin